MHDLIVSYDVSSDKKRRKLFKALHRWGYPLQKSVFHCKVKESSFNKMKRKLEKYIDFETDSILYVFLCTRCFGQLRQAGKSLNIEGQGLKIV